MLKLLSAVGKKKYQKKGDNAAANWQCAPEETLYRRRHGAVGRGMSGRNTVLHPEDHATPFINFFFAPSGKSQQRLVIRIVDENVLESILVAMFEHGAQCFHAVAAVIF